MADLLDNLRNDHPYCHRCREAADEIERLQERVAALQAQCGYTESIKAVEIERLLAALYDLRTRAQEEGAYHVVRRIDAAMNIHKRGGGT